MEILVVGAGLSGCSLARILKDKGHSVSIVEKENCVGGLCTTLVHENGLKYEPYGARTFHTESQWVRDFVSSFDEFNGYVHRKGMILNGECFPYPLTLESIERFPEKKQIEKELGQRKGDVDATNFETAAVSIFGPTLYRYFIENYSEKMWGVKPCELTSEWAPKRLELRTNSDDRLFKGQWQGLPRKGYSYLLEKMVEGIDVRLNCSTFNVSDHDLIISTAPIDSMLEYKYGNLGYRSIAFEYLLDEPWENDTFGTINLPQHSKFIRKCNFKVMHKQNVESTLIQFQEPVPAEGDNVAMYPVSTTENLQRFDMYLKSICHTNIMPAGRLGLFKYLDMDKAVEMSYEISSLAENFLQLTPLDKYAKLRKLIC